MSLGWAAEAAPAGGMDAVQKLIEQRMQMARDAEVVRSNMAHEQQAKDTLTENTALRRDTFGAQQADRDISTAATLGKSYSPGDDVTAQAPLLARGAQGPNMSKPAYTPMPAAAPPPGIADPTQDQTAPMPAATGGGPYVPDSPALGGAPVTKRITWLGTPQEREAKRKETEADAFVRGLPPGSDQNDAEYQLRLGHARPPDRDEVARQKQADTQENLRLAASLRPAPSSVSIYNGADGPQLVDKRKGTATPVTNASDGSVVKGKDPAAVEQQRHNAVNVLSHVNDIESEAQQIDKLGLMGPVGGRWADFMAGTIGAGELAAGDPDKARLLGKFRTDVGLLKSGMAMVHGGARGGGSTGMAGRMDMLMNAKTMDLPLFLGSTDAFKGWLQQYAGDKKESGGGEHPPMVNNGWNYEWKGDRYVATTQVQK